MTFGCTSRNDFRKAPRVPGRISHGHIAGVGARLASYGGDPPAMLAKVTDEVAAEEAFGS